MKRSLVVILLVLVAVATAAAAAKRPRGNVRVLALVPIPGYPALAYVHPNGRIYEGTYVNTAGDSLPSRVLEYTGGGTLMRSWTIRGQTLSSEHGVQVANRDARGRLVLLDRTPARVLILDPKTGSQRTYARFADLGLCATGSTGPNCSPALQDLAPEADYAAWGPDGSLYVTDYQQAVIWRVPPHGGRARVWLADKRLDGNMFGTAGLATTGRDHRTLLFTQASSAGLGELNPTTGKLYSVRIGAGGRPTALHKLWESKPAEAPDGLGIARSGHVYMAMAGPSSQIVEVDRNGKELARFGAFGSGDNGSSVPFDTPSNVSFLGTRAIIANQSFISGDTSHQAILDLETGEPGAPIYVPRRAGLPKR